MSLQFVVTTGPEKGKVMPILSGQDLFLGRAASACYQIADPRVSRSHCEVILEGEQVTLKCLGGSGGTLVNGKKIAQHLLRLGDVVQVGDSQFRLEMSDRPLRLAQDNTHPPAALAEAPKQPGPDELEALVNTTLSHYDIGPVIGKGRNGIVFSATDTKDHRPVAFKVMRPEFAENEDEVQRFIRAIKTMLPLRHPNLVTLYGAGKTGPHCWIAMEYIAGENLTQVIERIGVAGMLDWKNAFKVAVQVGRALEYAHGQDIIHRNVMPTNILREATTRDVKLGDLTLAKALEGSLAQQITRPGEIVGDLAYMSPERTRGVTDVDHRSDLYGLGATLYALLTGRPPFQGTTMVEKITRIRQDEPVKPTKFQLSIPHPFEGLVLKLLTKNPEDRYQSATAMLKELDRIARNHSVTL
jgi:serine/threonine protein kinase